MRLTAALTGILLVAVVGVAAVEDIRYHRKVLQDAKPAAASTTTATAPNETKAAGVSEGVIVTENAVNATKAANATSNSTSNDTRAGDGWGTGGSGPDRGPDYCFESISCRQAQAGAAGVNATAGAVNATGPATANATTSPGNASAEIPSGLPYHGSGTHDSWTVADQVHCALVGCKKRRRLATSAGSNVTAAATTQGNDPRAANITGNATGSGNTEETMSGGQGSTGPIFPGGPAKVKPICKLISCLKRKLMQIAAADTVQPQKASVANEVKAAGAESVPVTKGVVNATVAPGAAAVGATMAGPLNATGNATGNATAFRSRNGGHHGGDGDGWGHGGRPYGDRTPFGV